MPAWTDIIDSLGRQNPQEAMQWLDRQLQSSLGRISDLYGGANVICYSSAFLQKPHTACQIMADDINGFMTVVHQMDTSKGLVLLLHTPGGVVTAVETIVGYLHKKFQDITAVVPVYAMSGGTMIALASNKIVMGKQSQLGPIDPQMPFQNRTVSARAIIDGFGRAESDIERDTKLAHLWAPILQSMGPSLLVEASEALSYSEHLVETWLSKRMLADGRVNAEEVAEKFNAMGEGIFVHGQRIDIDSVREWGLVVEEMEENQEIQDAILTAYHFATVIFEHSATIKVICNHQGKKWVKNHIEQTSPPMRTAE